MPKYARKPALVQGQQQELYPLLDAALELPYGKAIVYETSPSRASWLYKTAMGERYRNAIESIAAYTSDDPLYGRGVYYHIVVDICSKGLVIANVENPPYALTWDIIRCAATRKPVTFTAPAPTAHSRLKKLKERFPDQLGKIYIDASQQKFCWAVPNLEELIIVDIDVSKDIPNPTAEQRAKAGQ